MLGKLLEELMASVYSAFVTQIECSLRDVKESDHPIKLMTLN